MKHKQGGSPVFDGRQPAAHLLRGRHLEDPAAEAEESMWRWTVSPEKAPDKAEYLDIEFEKGDLVAINGKRMPATNCWPAQPARRQARHRPSRPGREPLRRHEVARLLRNPRRHHPAARRTAPSSRSPSTAKSPTSRTT
jgi:hypothetical protein